MRQKKQNQDHGTGIFSAETAGCQLFPLFRVACFLFLVACLVSGCLPSRVNTSLSETASERKQASENTYFMRGRWWNYYHRGIDYGQSRLYEKARQDFETAISLRAKDQRMARTYGMHFIDYFPHRELGIIHYHRGEYQKADKELSTSIRQFSSAKAKYYLDKTRKAILRNSGVPKGSPEITFLSPALPGEGKEQQKDSGIPSSICTGSVSVNICLENAIRTSCHPVVIRGKVTDPLFVSGIRVAGMPVFLEGSEKKVVFEKKLNLPGGKHVISVYAENLMEGKTQKSLVLFVDRDGPLMTLRFEPKTLGAGNNIPDSLRMTLVVHDPSGVAEVYVNHAKRFPDDHHNPREDAECRSVDIPVSLWQSDKRQPVSDPFSRPLIFAAKDCLGNRTGTTIYLRDIYPRENGNRRFFQKTDLLLAKNPETAAFDGGIAFFGGRKKNDAHGPQISLKGVNDQEILFLDQFYLEGVIRDDSDISRVEVNGRRFAHTKGPFVMFSHMVPLEKGKNRIHILAEDIHGNLTAKTLEVHRKIPAQKMLAARLSVSVFPFSAASGNNSFANAFCTRLVPAFMERERFRMIERLNLEGILQELRLSRTDLVDPEQAVKAGRLIAVRAVLTGGIIETQDGVEVVAKMIDTETAEILSVQDVYSEEKDIPGIQELCRGLALKFHRDFPLLEGDIMEISGKNIVFDLGRKWMKPGRGVIVYREIPFSHPETGKLLGMQTRIQGNARITEVMEDASMARIEENSGSRVRQGDRVITE